jgi:hypothetical protein
MAMDTVGKIVGGAPPIAEPMSEEQQMAVVQNERTGMELQRLRNEYEEACKAVEHLTTAVNAALFRRGYLSAAVEAAAALEAADRDQESLEREPGQANR